MIFEHYRKWMNNLTRQDGGRIARLYRAAAPQFGHRMGTEEPAGAEKPANSKEEMMEAGGIENPEPGEPGKKT